MAQHRSGETVLQKLSRKARGKSTRFNRRRKLARTQALIVSYPKSGRTWLRVMLTHYIAQREGLANGSLDLYDATRRSSRFLLTDFHHEQAHHRLEIAHRDLVFDPTNLRNKDIIFLYRDPRDTAVSMYFQLTKRETLADGSFYQGSLSDMLRDERFGLEKIIRFNKLWLDNGHKCARFMSLCYEQIQENPAAQLGEVVEFLGDTNPDSALVNAACESARFDNMKQSEKAADYDHDSLGARIPGDDDSLKVRKGKVGGYRDYFSEADQHYADEMMSRFAIPTSIN